MPSWKHPTVSPELECQEVQIVQQKPERTDLLLWRAARDGDIAELANLLNAEPGETNINFQMNPEDLKEEEPVKYKNHKVVACVIHAAVLCPKLALAAECVKDLLKWQAIVDFEAIMNTGYLERRCQAIHMAAGMGNHKVISQLVEYKADVNAWATVRSHASEFTRHHYRPIHDAAWFGQVTSVQALLDLKADVFAKNNDGNTIMHLAAITGDVVLARLLAEQYPRLTRRGTNSEGLDALDLALKQGRFRDQDLLLFAFSDAGDTDDFVWLMRSWQRLAVTCPDAAKKMVRTHKRPHASGSDDVQGAGVLKNWKVMMQKAVACAESSSDVKTLHELMFQVPECAFDMLDMLTKHAPHIEVADRMHNPLPVRADLPSDEDDCSLASAYVATDKWDWPDDGRFKPPRWQVRLAPPNPARSQEVNLKMIQLPGILNYTLVYELATTKDMGVFDKLVTRAILKELWRSFLSMFLIDLGHQFLVTSVISYWILAAQMNLPMIPRCALWSLLAAEALVEAFTFVWTCAACWWTLGKKNLLAFFRHVYYRGIIGAFALALTIQTSADLAPPNSSSILLWVNCLLYSNWILFEISVLRTPGKKILPIMKLVLPIVCLLATMLLLSLSFINWSSSHGSHFVSELDDARRIAVVVLSVSSMLLVFACATNMFFPVFSDCYYRAPERTLYMFLMERARICSGLFLRPRLGCRGCVLVREGIRYIVWWRWALLIIPMLGFYIGLIYGTAIDMWNPWFVALYLAGAVVIVQGVLRSACSEGWGGNYLWFCHGAYIEDEAFPDQDLLERAPDFSDTAVKTKDLGRGNLVEASSWTGEVPIPNGDLAPVSMISARFDGGGVEAKFRAVHRLLKDHNFDVLMVDAGCGDDFGDHTMECLNRIDQENGIILAVCTEHYGEITASKYSSYCELKYAYDQDLRVLPLKVVDTYPPQPPCGPDHPYDKKGRARGFIKAMFPTSKVYLDCRDKCVSETARMIADQLLAKAPKAP